MMHQGIPRVARYKQDLEFGIPSDEFFAEETPVLAWHHHVGQQKVDGLAEAVEHLVRFDCIASLNNPVVQLRQSLNYVPTNLFFVLHNKDRLTSTHRGIICVGNDNLRGAR